MINNLERLKKEYNEYENKAIALSNILKDVENSGLVESLNKGQNFNEDIKGFIEKFKSPNVVVSVVAEVSNGKSTFLNSLIFKNNVLHSGLGAVTATIFKIKYDESYSFNSSYLKQKFQSIEELQEAVKQYNKKIREKVDNDEKVEIEEVTITLPDENLKQGIVLYDTPGFGALDEAQILPILKQAVSKSDAVIMLLDISQGLKKGEKEFVKNVLKSIPAKKRYIVLNKMDSVVDEDDFDLMDEKEIKQQIEKVTNDTLNELSKLSNIDKKEIRHYKVSAKKALVGYVKNKEEALKESNFIEFENDFWHKVISEKEEVFNERIDSFNELKNNVLIILNKQQVEIEKTLETLNAMKEALLTQRADLEAVLNNSINKFNQYKTRVLSTTEFDIDRIFREMEKIFYINIVENLESNISLFDKAKFWALQEKYEKEIESAMKKSESKIKSIINNSVNSFLENIYNVQEELNQTIEEVNTKLKSFDNLNISLIDKLDIVNKKGDRINIKNLNFNGYIDAPDYFNQTIWSIVAAEYAFIFLGPLGLIVGSVLAYLFSKNKENPNEKIAREITNEIMDKMDYDLKPKFKEVINKLRVLSIEIVSAPQNIETRLKEVLRSLESPEEKEKEIQKNQRNLDTLKSYVSQINNI